MARPRLGRQELEVLQFLSDHSPMTVAEVVAGYGQPRGLARTTILTVMERLRAKRYLTRRKVEGVFRYAPRLSKAELMRSVVGDFVERALGGSLQPFVAYLAADADLSEEEVRELRELLDSHRKQHKEACDERGGRHS